MGGQYRGYWDSHEEEQLRRGVQKHGIGSWERIRHDPEFKTLKCVGWAARAHAAHADVVQARSLAAPKRPERRRARVRAARGLGLLGRRCLFRLATQARGARDAVRVAVVRGCA